MDIDVIFTSPEGREYTTAGFWDGDKNWRVRFAPVSKGRWTWTSKASCESDSGLHGRSGSFDVVEYEGENPLYKHGFVRIMEQGRGFEHWDSTPFFWLADTVWSCPAKAELEEWKEFIDYRSRQGYNVMQMNSLPQHDQTGQFYRLPFASSAQGWDLNKPEASYFRILDEMVEYAAEKGIYSALVVLWFDYVPNTNPTWNIKRKALFTPEQAARYGRYLAARYGAYGAMWLVSGDTDYCDDYADEVYSAAARAIRKAYPVHTPMTAHLNGGLFTPERLNKHEWLSFHMHQSSHTERSKESAIYFARKNREYSPIRPVLNGEPCYEGAYNHEKKEKFRNEFIREVAWASIFAGGNAGLTYGAHGLWSWHREGECFGDTFTYRVSDDWRTAMQFPVARQMILLKYFFEKLEWWRLEPLTGDEWYANGAVAAAYDDKSVIVVYLPDESPFTVKIDDAENYHAVYYNPVTGQYSDCILERTNNGWIAQKADWPGDRVLLLKRESVEKE